MKHQAFYRLAPFFLSISIGACSSLPKVEEVSQKDQALEAEANNVLLEGIKVQQDAMRKVAFNLMSSSEIAANRVKKGDVPSNLCDEVRNVQELPDALALRYKASLLAQYRLKGILPEAAFLRFTSFNSMMDVAKINLGKVVGACDMKYGV